MIALLLALGFFLHFTVTGGACLAAISRRGSGLQRALLAPATGLAIHILITTVFNEAGWPVARFALAEAGITLAGAVALLAWRRPWLPGKPAIFGAALALGAIGYAGWPAVALKLNWLAYANDDMANYCLAAVRHLHHGFYDRPTLEALSGTDYSQYFWFMHVGGMFRFGSELILAWAAGWSGLSPAQIFMPMMLAQGAVLVLSTAALARAGRCSFRVTVGGAALLALSPLFVISIYYQLIAQVGGLGLMLAVAAVLADRRPGANRATFRARALASGILGAALCVTYPEITPFALLGYGLQVAVLGVQRRLPGWSVIGLPCGTLVVIALLLWHNLLIYLNTLLVQSASGSAAAAAGDSVVLFPYFLLPSGLANLLGLQPIAQVMAEPFNSVLIVASALLLAVAVFRAVRATFAGALYGAIAAVMFGVGALLFVRRVDFGLFKLAMFCQPVLMLLLADGFLRRRRGWAAGLGVVFVLVCLPTARRYAIASQGDDSRGFISLPGISRREIALRPPAGTTALSSGIDHIVAAKLAAAELAGTGLYWNSRDYFEFFDVYNRRIAIPPAVLRVLQPHAEEILAVPAFWAERRRAAMEQREVFGSRFSTARVPAVARAAPRLAVPPPLSLFNHFQPPEFPARSFFAFQAPSVEHPRLSFINSSRGEHFYLPGDLKTVGLNQVEPDYYAPAQRIAALGRFLLFRVDPAPDQLYLRVALTRTLMDRKRKTLPTAARIQAETNLELPFRGAGAANVFLGPIRPQVVGDVAYVALDLGEEGLPFVTPRTGVMALYNRDVPLDPRYVVAFGRDISALTPAAYATMTRPRTIEHFPHDLVELPTLEFSGWFEDAWISRESYAILAPVGAGDRLRLHGMVPQLGELARGQHLEVWTNGVRVHEAALAPGEFELAIALPAGVSAAAATRVDLRFAREERLPSGDDRPVAARIDFLGFVHD